MSPRSGFTTAERGFDTLAHRVLSNAPSRGIRGGFIEFVVFVVKQAWACLFGVLLLAVLLAARLWYPDAAPIARNDAITLAAVAIQIAMLAFRLEAWRELRVIVTFHIVGTAMELFKTGVGSWVYDAGECCTSAPCPCSVASCTGRSARTWCVSSVSSTSASRDTRRAG